MFNQTLTPIIGIDLGSNKSVLAIFTPVDGKKPHDPGFDVRKALYLIVGLDLTAIDGIDEIHALTLISELGTDFSKRPTVKHLRSASRVA